TAGPVVGTGCSESTKSFDLDGDGARAVSEAGLVDAHHLQRSQQQVRRWPGSVDVQLRLVSAAGAAYEHVAGVDVTMLVRIAHIAAPFDEGVIEQRSIAFLH